MKIGVFRSNGFFGDCLVTLDLLYLLHKMYGGEVVVLASSASAQVFTPLPYVKIVKIEGLSDRELLSIINGFNFDAFIEVGDRRILDVLRASNVKKVVTRWKLRSFLTCKFRCIYMSARLNPMHESRNLTRLAQRLDKAAYKRAIANIDFAENRLSNFVKKGDGFAFAKEGLRIMVNPFANHALHNLSIGGYIALIKALKNLKVQIVVPVYENEDFIKAIKKEMEVNIYSVKDGVNTDMGANVSVYNNDKNYINLVPLLESCDLLITPSTSTAHLASNLGKRIIGIYDRAEVRWRAKVYKYQKEENIYIYPTSPLDLMGAAEEAGLIDEIVQKVEGIIDQKL